jgi:hypothetical protein
MMTNHQFFEIVTNFFLQKNSKKTKMWKQYFAHISMKTWSNSKNNITKMISEKFSTNPESFIKFGRGRRIDLATSHGNTHISIHSNIGKCHCYFDDSFIFNSHLLFRLYVYISILLFFFFFFVSISFFEYKVTHRTNRWKNHTMIQWNEEEPPYTSSSSFFVFFFFIESSKKEEKR